MQHDLNSYITWLYSSLLLIHYYHYYHLVNGIQLYSQTTVFYCKTPLFFKFVVVNTVDFICTPNTFQGTFNYNWPLKDLEQITVWIKTHTHTHTENQRKLVTFAVFSVWGHKIKWTGFTFPSFLLKEEICGENGNITHDLSSKNKPRWDPRLFY